MRQKRICHWAIALVIALLFTACAGLNQGGETETADLPSLTGGDPASTAFAIDGQFEAIPAAEPSPAAGLPETQEALRAFLSEGLQALVSQDRIFLVETDISLAGANITFTEQEAYTAYWCGAHGGLSLLMVHEKQTGDFYATLFPYMNISDVMPGEADGTVVVYSSGDRFGFDHLVHTSNQELLVHYRQPDSFEVIGDANPYVGTLGITTGEGDAFTFASASVEGKSAYFTFGTTGYFTVPAIYTDMDWQEDGPVLLLAFKDTENTLPQEFVQQLVAVEGVRHVEVLYAQEPVFTGTQLLVQLETGYWARLYTTGPELYEVDGFHFTVLEG